ncbi:hypothetical protein GCM10027426_07180 [Microbacterium lacusdiani]
MTYLEFDRDAYIEIGDHATLRGLDWFASPWDVPSVEFLEDLRVVAHKVASACLTDIELLDALRGTGKPIILSTGISTMEQIDAAVERLGTDRLVLMHATSTYPMEPEEANLRMLGALRDRFPLVPEVGRGAPAAGTARVGARAGRGRGCARGQRGPAARRAPWHGLRGAWCSSCAARPASGRRTTRICRTPSCPTGSGTCPRTW